MANQFTGFNSMAPTLTANQQSGLKQNQPNFSQPMSFGGQQPTQQTPQAPQVTTLPRLVSQTIQTPGSPSPSPWAAADAALNANTAFMSGMAQNNANAGLQSLVRGGAMNSDEMNALLKQGLAVNPGMSTDQVLNKMGFGAVLAQANTGSPIGTLNTSTGQLGPIFGTNMAQTGPQAGTTVYGNPGGVGTPSGSVYNPQQPAGQTISGSNGQPLDLSALGSSYGSAENHPASTAQAPSTGANPLMGGSAGGGLGSPITGLNGASGVAGMQNSLSSLANSLLGPTQQLTNAYNQTQEGLYNQNYTDPQGVQQQLAASTAQAGLGESPLGANLQNLGANRYWANANSQIGNQDASLYSNMLQTLPGFFSAYLNNPYAQEGAYQQATLFNEGNAPQQAALQSTLGAVGTAQQVSLYQQLARLAQQFNAGTAATGQGSPFSGGVISGSGSITGSVPGIPSAQSQGTSAGLGGTGVLGGGGLSGGGAGLNGNPGVFANDNPNSGVSGPEITSYGTPNIIYNPATGQYQYTTATSGGAGPALSSVDPTNTASQYFY